MSSINRWKAAIVKYRVTSNCLSRIREASLHHWTSLTNKRAVFLWCYIPVCPVIKSSTPWAPAIWLKNPHNAADSAVNTT